MDYVKQYIPIQPCNENIKTEDRRIIMVLDMYWKQVVLGQKFLAIRIISIYSYKTEKMVCGRCLGTDTQQH